MAAQGTLAGQVVVVTGASTGIGAAGARQLHELGATVHVVGRNPAKTAAVAATLGTPPLVADFERLADVRRLAHEIGALGRLDLLANNAGGTWPRRRITGDGQERTFQVNHLAPYLLTRLLIEQGPGVATVVTTASEAHRLARLRMKDPGFAHGLYSGALAYGTSKLDNILFARELARRVPGVRSASFHPGVVASEFSRDSFFFGLLYKGPARRTMRTVDDGADTLVWLAENDDWANGGYFADRSPGRLSGAAGNDELARDLWDVSARLVGLEP